MSGPVPCARFHPRGRLWFLLSILVVSVSVSLPAVGCSQSAASQLQTPVPKPLPKSVTQLKPAPPTPIAIKKVELGEGDPWRPAWTRMIEKALPRNLLSRRRAPAIGRLCPRYRDLSLANRRAFWAYFFQALAGAEAGLKPTADVRHAEPQVAVIDPVTHRIARQEGLLQLAYMDSLRYGCNFNWQRDQSLPEHDPAKTILKPRNNLLCGIRIIDYQLIARHEPVLSDSSYWVTLRPDSPSMQMFLRQMANVPAACGSPLRSPVTDENPLLPLDDTEKMRAPSVPHPAKQVEPRTDVIEALTPQR